MEFQCLRSSSRDTGCILGSWLTEKEYVMYKKRFIGVSFYSGADAAMFLLAHAKFPIQGFLLVIGPTLAALPINKKVYSGT